MRWASSEVSACSPGPQKGEAWGVLSLRPPWAIVKTSVSKEGRSKREERRQLQEEHREWRRRSNFYFTSVIDPNVSGRAIYCIYKWTFSQMHTIKSLKLLRSICVWTVQCYLSKCSDSCVTRRGECMLVVGLLCLCAQEHWFWCPLQMTDCVLTMWPCIAHPLTPSLGTCSSLSHRREKHRGMNENYFHFPHQRSWLNIFLTDTWLMPMSLRNCQKYYKPKPSVI